MSGEWAWIESIIDSKFAEMAEGIGAAVGQIRKEVILLKKSAYGIHRQYYAAMSIVHAVMIQYSRRA